MQEGAEPMQPMQPNLAQTLLAAARCRLQGIMKYPPPPTGEDEEEKPGDTFEGEMAHGKRQGVGKYTWSNGAVYEGPYEENKKHGQGKMTFPDKSVYEGGAGFGPRYRAGSQCTPRCHAPQPCWR